MYSIACGAFTTGLYIYTHPDMFVVYLGKKVMCVWCMAHDKNSVCSENGKNAQ